MGRQRLVFVLTLLATVILEISVAPEIAVGSVKPGILLTVLVCWAILEGPRSGAVFGFWGGLLEGIFTTTALGVTALVKTVAGYLVGEIRRRVVSRTVIWPMAVVFLTSVLHELSKFALWAMLGIEGKPALRLGVLFGFALYNSLLTLPVYPVVLRLARREEETLMF